LDPWGFLYHNLKNHGVMWRTPPLILLCKSMQFDLTSFRWGVPLRVAGRSQGKLLIDYMLF
jgi:hypothetical protein